MFYALFFFRSSIEFFDQYDSSEMAFNPSIPAPRPIDLLKCIKGRHFYVNDEFDVWVKDILTQPIAASGSVLDFHGEIKKSLKRK